LCDTGEVYKVEVYARVRRAVQVDGMSIRQAAQEFGLARKTIRDFGILKWPSSAICFGPPRERTGTLIRAQPEAEELVGLESESGVVRTDPSRV
jgi:hypothetical protein